MASHVGKEKGDAAYNARRRFYRSAERYLDQARKNTGATAERYRELARINLKDAMKTYEVGTKQKFSRPMQRLANELGVDIEGRRRELQVERTDKKEEALRKAAVTRAETARAELLDLEGGKSVKALASARTETLREDEARAILNSPIGHRVIGGLVGVWQEGATYYDENMEAKIDKTKILPQLFDYFNVGSVAELLEKIEDITGDTLYSHNMADEIYETVKLMLQKHVASHPVA